MKTLFTARTVFTALVFGAVFSLVVAYAGTLAMEHWGRPRGAPYGVFVYYYWLFLSLCGLAMVFVFRSVPVWSALAIFLAVITVPTYLLLPNIGERPILTMYGSAILMCSSFAVWKYYRIKVGG